MVLPVISDGDRFAILLRPAYSPPFLSESEVSCAPSTAEYTPNSFVPSCQHTTSEQCIIKVSWKRTSKREKERNKFYSFNTPRDDRLKNFWFRAKKNTPRIPHEVKNRKVSAKFQKSKNTFKEKSSHLEYTPNTVHLISHVQTKWSRDRTIIWKNL